MTYLALLVLLILGTETVLSSFPKNGDIIGGSNVASDTDYPFMVSVRDSSNNHLCGGSIINSRHVLTAAHCVYQKNDTRVNVGSRHLTNGTSYNVSSTKIHEGFNATTFANNIAVLRTVTQIIFTSSILPVTLVPKQITSGKAIVLGWGGIDVNTTSVESLQYLEIDIINTVLCGYLLPRLNEDNICTSGSNTTGIASKDLGGPLFVQDEGQVGVQTFINGESADGTPDVYASSFHHRNWILDNS